jgi:hypothetical protein
MTNLPAKIEQEVLAVAPANIDPIKEVEFARKCAVALVDIIKNKKKKVMMNGEQYIEFEDWQTLARFYRLTVGIEWSKPYTEDDGNVMGYGARAIVTNENGQTVSAAEADCRRDERNWMDKPDFQLRSMAQTRASAKALRNVLAWVVVLAEYKDEKGQVVKVRPTPAEELNGGDQIQKDEATIGQKKLLAVLLKEKKGVEINEIPEYLTKVENLTLPLSKDEASKLIKSLTTN